jgi:hypothetical protein
MWLIFPQHGEHVISGYARAAVALITLAFGFLTEKAYIPPVTELG